MRHHFICFLIAVPLLAAGCTTFPELDGAVSPTAEAADYPDLVPLEPLLVAAEATGPSPQATTQSLNARVSALRARAAGLRRGIIDPATRRRMAAGVN